jgi:hypothetical protein
MKKHLMGLGIALVVALSMSVVASAAQAESFKSASYPASMYGTQTTSLKFTISSGRSWTCSTANLISPSLSADSPTLSLSPEFSGCSIKVPPFGYELDVTMLPGHCALKLLEPAGKQGGASIDCPAGESILVNVYNGKSVSHIDSNRICQYSIPAQASQGGLQYVNNPLSITASMDLWVSVKRIVGTTTNCGAIEQSMTLTGSIVLTGSNGKIEVG